MKKVMITGFGPFLTNSENPSGEICSRLGEVKSDIKLIGLKLPVCYHDAARALTLAIEQEGPSAVISLGLAADRAQIEIEKVAINYRHSKSPDNKGQLAQHEEIERGGPAGFMTTLPYQAIIESLDTCGITVGLSLNAGSYVCNEVFYRLMQSATARGIPAGFIHLPQNSATSFLTALPTLLSCLDLK